MMMKWKTQGQQLKREKNTMETSILLPILIIATCPIYPHGHLHLPLLGNFYFEFLQMNFLLVTSRTIEDLMYSVLILLYLSLQPY